MSNILALPQYGYKAKGWVNAYEFDPDVVEFYGEARLLREYRKLGEHAAGHQNTLTDRFLNGTLTLVKDAVTYQALGTSNTTPTSADTKCNFEKSRKAIPTDSKLISGGQLLFNTYWNPSDSVCAKATVSTAPSTVSLTVAALGDETVNSVLLKLRVGDWVKVSNSTTDYGYSKIASISGSGPYTITLNGSYPLNSGVTSASGLTITQVIAEAAILGNVVSTTVATSGSAGSGLDWTFTVASAAGLSDGDILAIATGASTHDFATIKTGGISGTSITVTWFSEARTPYVGGAVTMGYAYNHVAGLNYIKQSTKAVVTETLIEITAS